LIPIATFLDSQCKESVTASVKLMEGTETRIIEQQQLRDAWPGQGSSVCLLSSDTCTARVIQDRSSGYNPSGLESASFLLHRRSDIRFAGCRRQLNK
jgi:hypothetical protein